MRSSTMRPRPRYLLHRGSGVTRTLTAALIILGSAGLTGSLTGCLTGDGAAGEFGRLLADESIVDTFELSSADNMPFTGGVGGVVELSDYTSEAQLRDLSERIVEFAAEDEAQADNHSADQPSRIQVDLLIDGWRFPVLTEPAAQQALLDVILDQRSDGSLTSGSVSSRAYRADVTHVALDLSEETNAFDALDNAATRFSEAGMSPVVAVDGPTPDGGSITLEGTPGPWLETARQSYDAVGAQVSLTAFEAEAEEITVTVREERDAPLAASALEAALGRSGITPFVQSELLTLAPRATGETARAVFATMDPGAFASVASAWSDDRNLQLQIDTVDHVDEVVDTLAENADAETLESIRISVGPPDDPTFRMESSAAELPRALREAQESND